MSFDDAHTLSLAFTGSREEGESRVHDVDEGDEEEEEEKRNSSQRGSGVDLEAAVAVAVTNFPS